ncbi:MAG: tyrosine--tRNA ligase [Alphaproteobacteria bacterium]|nr:tyrosine--tRNA ligase [Alphaproteobacteria bacterium]
MSLAPNTLASPKSALVRTLQERGYLHQCTDLSGLDAAAASGVVPGYIGFDMTAPSLHVGSLIQIMLLRRLQQAGGKPIVLLGGGTTKVGDPSGKDSARKMLTDEDIARNMAAIRGVFEKFLTFGDGPTDAVMIDNDAWLSRYGYIEFLRTFGPHFTINRMLTFDSVKLRLEREQPLTFLEFNYMLMQAVDFLELFKRVGCRLQMGGSDQWGNIVNGVEITRRMAEAQVFGLTTPLLTTASGAKMGKTEAGAVWLNADMLSAYEYWQFWRNAEDADVGRFLRLFTDMPLDEIARYEGLQGAEINDAKKALANAATAMLHGAAAAAEAEAAARATFEQGGRADALPTVEAPRAEIEGLRVAAALTRAGLTESNGEAKRHIKAGAVRVNDAPISDENAALSGADIVDGAIKLSLGKKKHALLRAV